MRKSSNTCLNIISKANVKKGSLTKVRLTLFILFVLILSLSKSKIVSIFGAFGAIKCVNHLGLYDRFNSRDT